ncbi:MAG TPA: DUF262 domain-containing HNH endonuclease family protein [Candidatus Margulisiibacteriota bacterium]|nr:DUF262 domain-containing HNH endonuclease family protein [Candidatus Margulisiibacteriota bacterium]
MDARAKTVRDILLAGDQYLVPFFQRHYEWQRKHWQRLLDDVIALLDDDSSQHFLGPLVCTPFRPVPGEATPYQLIDGQQRLTTITLALAGLRDVARRHHEAELADEIAEDYLTNKRRKGTQRFKVVPRTGDREIFFDIMEERRAKTAANERRVRGDGSGGINACLNFYKKAWDRFAKEHPPAALRRLFVALTGRLSLVAVTIEGENPYEIFESLNSTGLPLEESDLIRNYIFMQVPLEEQDDFEHEHWQPFEAQFLATAEDDALSSTGFFRNYLMRTGVYSKNRATFVGFKEQNRNQGLSPVEQVKELQRFARYELWLQRPHTCDHPRVRRALQRIALIDVTTAYPLLFVLLDKFAADTLSEDQLIECLEDFISFVLRRTICGESTRGYGRWFADAINSVRAGARDGLREYWLQKGWPDDRTFLARLQDFDLYRRERRKCRLILESLEESFGHKESVDLSSLSIEHIMPQTIGDDSHGRAWRRALGDDWKRVHQRWLHTLPNLTLTGYNPELANRPFEEKRGDYDRSNLSLNRELARFAVWNESSLLERGRKLGSRVASLWPRPSDGPEYKPVAEVASDEGDLFAPVRSGRGRTPQGSLSVTLRWTELGVDRPTETLQERTSAQTMSAFLARLIQHFGPDLVSKLQSFRLGRGPLISTRPRTDFVNPRSGEVYGHVPIRGTSFAVITHSSTNEKVRDLRRLVDFLEMPAGFAEIGQSGTDDEAEL